jgi:hypothetical protein
MSPDNPQISAASSRDDTAPPRPQFTLRTLLGVIALIGLVLAPFANFDAEALGPLLRFAVLSIFLGGLYKFAANPANEVIVVVGVVLLAGFLIMPGTGPGHAPPGSFCRINVQSLRTALENYAQQHHDLYPSASVPGPDGRPWHSWRVLILPYIGEQAQHADYWFLEPWDGPNNRQLARSWPRPFCCTVEPNKSAPTTTLVLVTGPGSAWGEGTPPSRARLEKLPADTIVMMEVKNTGIHWMEPRDLTIDEIMNIVDTKGLRSIAPHNNVLIALCARGYVDQVDLSIDHESLRRRLTAADD